MEKESQEILRQHLIQLREEMIEIKRLLHEANSFVKECKKGVEAISKTGNPRVADVFLEELNKELNDIQ